MVGGARATTKLLRQKRCDESDAPSTTLRVVPLPRYRGGGKTKRSRSHGAIFVRARVFRPPFFLTPSPLRRSRISLCSSGLHQEGEAERRETRRQTRALRARGALLRSALASRRPTAALARETAGPQGPAPGHASEEQSGAFDPVRPPQPGGGDLALAVHDPDRVPVTRQDQHHRGRTRAGNERLSPYSEHLACRSLCRQDDARCRPGAGYKSARGHRARPVPRSVLAKNVPSKGEMRVFYLPRRRTRTCYLIPAIRATGPPS